MTVPPAGGPLTDQPATATDDPWRLSLSSAGKNVLTTMVVLGALAFVAAVTANLVNTSNTVNNAIALSQVQQANTALTKGSQGIPTAIRACNGQLACVTGLIRKEAGYLETFDSQIQGLSLTGQAATDAATLVSDDKAAVADLNQLAAATSNAQYLNIASSSTLQQDLNSASADYSKLVRDLGGVSG